MHEGARSAWEGRIIDGAAGVPPRVWVGVCLLWELGAGEWSHAFDFAGKRITLRFRPIGA